MVDTMFNFLQFLYQYKKGCEYNAYTRFGAHITTQNGKTGVRFAVFAPHAKTVYLAGDFNNWCEQYAMQPYQGIWTAFIENAEEGQFYKYLIEDKNGKKTYKADPFAFSSELRPKSASVISNPFSYRWSDGKWMRLRAEKNHSESPISIYEVQLSSWDACVKDNKPINLRKTGRALIEYVKSMYYTHIELMPITEYPLDASWGYQTTGYYALSGRYGHPIDLQYFVNLAHKEGLGIILDWVPGHFCPDEHGLYKFDGTDLFGDRQHPHWGTYEFDFTKKFVWSFFISSAVFWAKQYHIDGIRVDGVTSMLYLNYGSDEVTKRNAFGGEDDLYAKDFLQQFNNTMHEYFPGFLTFAEESSAYQGVTAPTDMDGLGFDYKWNMGWMNDTLAFFSANHDDKKHNHEKITFSSVYLRDEKFVLPFSHDEVVHGKVQMLDKMPGDDWYKFALLRTLLAYQTLHPGKKLIFMGIDFAQRLEWRYYEPLEWSMLKYPIHDSFHEYIRMLNNMYIQENALFEMDNDIYGFEWIDGDNRQQSVFSFIRRAMDGSEIIAVINASRYTYEDFRMGVPKKGVYKEIMSSNLNIYDGSGIHNGQDIIAEDISCHGRGQSIRIVVPVLSAAAFKIDAGVNNV